MVFPWPRASIVIVLFACFGSLAAAQDYRSLSNLDFEQGAIDSLPPGWTARSALQRGYRVTLTDRQPHGGRRAAQIRRDTVVWTPDYGTLGKKIDARPYRGRRVRVAGWLRFENPQGPPGLGGAALYMSVDREGGGHGFGDNTQDQLVRASEWTARELPGDVADDADSIAFGAYLDRSGRAWVDDVSLTTLGPAGAGNQPLRALTERGTQNLVALARLLGYVRHFHPSDESAAADWDALAIAGADEVEPAATPAALAAALEKVFHPIAPTVRVATRPLSPLTAAMLRPAGARPPWERGWRHHGWGGAEENFAYYDRRPWVAVGAKSDSIAAIGSEVSEALGGGVWCSVPLTLYADDKGTLPRGSGSPPRPRRAEGWIPAGKDRGTRLAAVILFWNIAQHFYPYFDVVGGDWPAQLPVALRRAAENRDCVEFEMTLRRLAAQLHDGHGGVSSPCSDRSPMPLAWALVEGRLVVTRADTSIAARVHAGDEVTAIADRPVTAWVKEAEALVSAATPQYTRVRVAQALQALPGTDSVWLDLRSPSGGTRRESVSRRNTTWLKPWRPDSIATLRPGVLYVDLDRVTEADFHRVLPALVKAKGVIFDLRGYPRRLSIVPLAHLTDSTMTCARWNIPVVIRPDRRDMAFDFSNWKVEPRSPRIAGRVAFIIDGTAISYAETYMGIVENYHLAERVGEPTAGTNGNINRNRLPGGYNVIFTGMKVLKHDGSRHHGVGILPTVPVSPTFAGIAAHRDEQLEKAIEVVSR
jgi:C-terminal processing protease CtpA/Prc